MIKEILLLGNPKLYEISTPVSQDELKSLKPICNDLHDTMMNFKKTYGAGRAIAAPQIGVMKRLIYMYIDKPQVFINPILKDQSSEMITLWDDCMSFPELMVKVNRHKSLAIEYMDKDWNPMELRVEGDLSELIQHEYDHLEGILAVSRAIDGRSFAFKSQLN